MSYPAATVLIVLVLAIVALVGLILRQRQTWRRIKLGVFIERNGAEPPTPPNPED